MIFELKEQVVNTEPETKEAYIPPQSI